MRQARQECFPLRAVETEGPPVSQRLIRACERTFQHEFAERTMGSHRRGVQRTFRVLGQAQIKLFAGVVRVATGPSIQF